MYAVVGATGQQGGATVRALLAQGAAVRGLTRDPSSASARSLTEQGVEMVRADNADPASLRAAFEGAEGVFAVTTPERGTDQETADGLAIVDAVQAAGVGHLAFSSVGGAERHTGIPHFDSKRLVEEHIERLGMSATILRPVFFMDNLAAMMAPSVEDGTLVLRMPLPDGIPLQMVAVPDIGAAAALALRDPSAVPAALELAGDEVTGSQAAAAFGDARGLPARYEALPVEVLPDEDMTRMFTWFTELPAYQADLAACRRLVPALHTFRDWVAEQG